MQITLEEVEREYQREIQSAIDRGVVLTPVTMLALSVSLFEKIEVKGISEYKDKDADMLLFQYGTYNCGDEFCEYFSFDMTHQFMAEDEDEPYQLSFELIYDAKQFVGIRSYNCWSMDYSGIESFAAHVKTTDGFKAAENETSKTYRLRFEQC